MSKKENSKNLTLGSRERWNTYIDSALYEIGRIEDDIEDLDVRYRGLTDLDHYFGCISGKLDLVLRIRKGPEELLPERAEGIAREQAVSALSYLEDITGAAISLDQKPGVLRDPALRSIRDQLEEVIAAGGADLFQAPASLGNRSSKLVLLLERAVFKFTDRDRETRMVPGEIEEGDEEIITADRITMPVSQAALLVREEYIPKLEKLLSENPGDPELQEQLKRLKSLERFYSSIKKNPRARPLLPEKDLYTRSIAGYDRNGEMLVRMNMPAILSSGNRYDRLLDEIKRQVIHTAAGKKISPELDEEARYGPITKGVRRRPLIRSNDHLKSNPLYRRLAVQYPFLRRLENRDELKKIIALAESGNRQAVRRYLHGAVIRDRNLLWSGKPLELDLELPARE